MKRFALWLAASLLAALITLTLSIATSEEPHSFVHWIVFGLRFHFIHWGCVFAWLWVIQWINARLAARHKPWWQWLFWHLVSLAVLTTVSSLLVFVARNLVLGLPFRVSDYVTLYWGSTTSYVFHLMSFASYLMVFIASLGYLFYREARTQEAMRRSEELRAADLESQLKTVQLQALTARLRPHFLFNMLNTFVGLLEEKETAVVREAIGRLARLLRAFQETSNLNRWTLSDELAHVENYLELCRLRFEHRLDWRIEVPQGLDAPLPPMSVLTLVENAIEHVIEGGHGNRLDIVITPQAGHIEISVADNGIFPDPPRFEYGSGLTNLDRQIRIRFQGQGTFAIDYIPGKGSRARLRVPRPGPQLQRESRGG